MIIHADEISHHDRYRLLIGSVLPRPIAWVSTMNAAGQLNLAPFSYFNVVCPTPMTLVFCPAVHSNGRKKDSWRNIEEVPEFVVNITNEDTAEVMNQTSAVLPAGQSEFEWAGLTPAPSQTVRVPRVAESPMAFECTLDRIVVISDQPGGGAAIFGRVRCIYVRDDIYDNGRIDLSALRPIGRLAGDGYARISDVFSMPRPEPIAEREG